MKRRDKRSGLTCFPCDGAWAAIVDALKCSSQEAMVLRLVIAGCKERAVARRTRVSVSTVGEYMKRLYRKLGVHDRVGLCLRVFGAYQGWLSQAPARADCPVRKRLGCLSDAIPPDCLSHELRLPSSCTGGKMTSVVSVWRRQWPSGPGST